MTALIELTGDEDVAIPGPNLPAAAPGGEAEGKPGMPG